MNVRHRCFVGAFSVLLITIMVLTARGEVHAAVPDEVKGAEETAEEMAEDSPTLSRLSKHFFSMLGDIERIEVVRGPGSAIMVQGRSRES